MSFQFAYLIRYQQDGGKRSGEIEVIHLLVLILRDFDKHDIHDGRR